VEAKRPTPDWMQMKVRKNEAGLWVGVDGAKIPAESKRLFETVLGTTTLFNGKTPTFLERSVTHEEWVAIKKAEPDFNDQYIACEPTTIADLYKAKKCAYIQVDGKGLYHTGEDVCGFNVPYFTCAQRIRIRTKIHATCNAAGYASLTVTAAAQPVCLKDLVPSPFSLDTASLLPTLLLPLSVSYISSASSASSATTDSA